MSLLYPRIGGKAAWWLSVLGALCCFPALAGRAEGKAKPSETPQVLESAGGKTEVGVLFGAEYRIDVPAQWNGSLVVWYHGYSEHGTTFHIAQPVGNDIQNFLQRHYAVAQSAYSEPGWALQQAYPETEALRRYFDRRYGHPREAYVVGRSMGGALVMISLELNPKPYLGGLDLCGAVGPTFASLDRRFAFRAAFDHYFPGVMGPLVPVAADFDDTRSVRERIAAALRTNPVSAGELRDLMGLHTDQQVARDIAYFTFVIADMQRRSGGNPFDNRNWIYSGANAANSAADQELNASVQRYAASTRAREYLMRHYTPSGRLGKPMLAVHTVFDPYVPPLLLTLYSQIVEGAGAGDRLVQQYVPHDGHCAISPDEIGHAFDELVTWTHGGPRPTPGLLHDSQTR